jgi:hypothetical protein
MGMPVRCEQTPRKTLEWMDGQEDKTMSLIAFALGFLVGFAAGVLVLGIAVMYQHWRYYG